MDLFTVQLDDIIYNILSFLDYSSLLDILYTSKVLSIIGLDIRLWSELAERDSEFSAKRFKSFIETIKENDIENITCSNASINNVLIAYKIKCDLNGVKMKYAKNILNKIRSPIGFYQFLEKKYDIYLCDCRSTKGIYINNQCDHIAKAFTPYCSKHLSNLDIETMKFDLSGLKLMVADKETVLDKVGNKITISLYWPSLCRYSFIGMIDISDDGTITKSQTNGSIINNHCNEPNSEEQYILNELCKYS